MLELVVLIDKKDHKISLMDKLEAHRGKGKLHRAVSVLLYRKVGDKAEVFLQQRSKNKPLWPLYWSNTVCTHPRDDEDNKNCCLRRLKEEMGIVLKKEELVFIFKLRYRAKYNKQLSENEITSVFVGEWDGKPQLNSEEAESSKWIGINVLEKDIVKNSNTYTPWFIKLIANQKTVHFFKNQIWSESK